MTPTDLRTCDFSTYASKTLIENIYTKLKPRGLCNRENSLFSINQLVTVIQSDVPENLGRVVRIRRAILELSSKKSPTKVAYFSPGELYIVIGNLVQTDGTKFMEVEGIVSLCLGQNLRPATSSEISSFKDKTDETD